MNTKNLTWNVTSLNGADPFNVVAPNLEDAVCDALVALGWTISPSPVIAGSEPEPCRHCGRVYDDAEQCLSNDCPSRDEFITSSDILVLVKNQGLELLLSLNGFPTKRFLSAGQEGLFSHTCGNGEVSEISAEDFLGIYPDALGKVWRVVRVVSKKPVSRKSLALTIKGLLANCFYLGTYTRMFYLG